MNEQHPDQPWADPDRPGAPAFSAPDVVGAPQPAQPAWQQQAYPQQQPYQQQQPQPAWQQPGPPQAMEPRAYPQLLRGPRHAWWRPLVGLAVVLGLCLVVLVLMTVAMFVGLLLTGAELEQLTDEDTLIAAVGTEPWFLLLNNVLLAAGIPIAMLAVWVGHGWRPRWVNSVGPRIRWRWLAVSSAVALAVQLIATAALFAFDGVPEGRGDDVLVLLLIVFLTTPLQAAGEEYFFRGWMTQALGSWFRGAMVSALVPALVTAMLFAVAHGGQNFWLFLDRFAFGLLASYLTWRTGGLEAAIGAHAVNNVVVFVPVILTGTLEESLLIKDAPWQIVVLDIVVMAIIGTLLVLLARRLALRRHHDPAAQPGNPVPPPQQPPWQGRGSQAGPVLVPPGSTG